MIASFSSNACDFLMQVSLSPQERHTLLQRHYSGNEVLLQQRQSWLHKWSTTSVSKDADNSFFQACSAQLLQVPDYADLLARIPFGPCLTPWIAEAHNALSAVWHDTTVTARRSLVEILARDMSDVAHAALFSWYQERRPIAEGGFAHFADFVRSPEGQAELSRRYPSLVVWLTMLGRQWTAMVTEFLHRLAADGPRLSYALSAEEVCLDSLTEISAPDADRHYHGKRVLIAHFAHGSRLIYKPRPMSMEAAFASMVARISEVDARFWVPTVSVIEGDCGTYGWAEFLHQVDLPPEQANAQLAVYYQRAGRLLALVSVLAGRDMHMDNLIATADGPALVDCECLMQPEGGRDLSWWLSASSLLGEATALSSDIGGFTGTGESPSLNPSGSYIHVNQDEMERRQQATLSEPGKNLPRVAGQPRMPGEWVHALEAGFREALTATMEHQAVFLDCLEVFVRARVRVVLRPSSFYGNLMREAVQPAALSPGVEQASAMEPLLATLVSPSLSPPDLRILKAEYTALARLDLPVFWTTPLETHLWADDETCATACFSQCSLASVRARIQAMKASDLVQCTSLLTRRLSAKNEPQAANISLRPTSIPPSVEAVAHDCVAAVISSLSHRPHPPDSEVDWLRSVSLYNGTLGIALFCAAAERVLALPEAGAAGHTLASQAWETWILWRTTEPQTWGAFEGLGALVLGFAAMATITEHDIWLDRALEVATWPTDGPPPDLDRDLVYGTAGWLAALADLALHLGPDQADRLMPALEKAAAAVLNGSPLGTGGLAHGQGGLALALAKAGAVPNGPKCRGGIKDALSHEVAAFDPELLGWVFQTNLFGQRTAMNAWCSGTSGMALVLSELRRLDHDVAPMSALEPILLKKLTSPHFSTVDHWCCGNSGRLSICHSLALAGHGVPHGFARGAQDMLAAHYARNRGLSLDLSADAHPLAVASLFRGLSGPGYTFLRFLAPEALPDLLAVRSHLT
jgi:type 2 lantibiotic biosynthesis protein LanM